MNRTPGDGLPWYRHSWPWLIVGLLGVSIVGSIATVFIAYAGRDPLVQEDWYDQGVAINDELARRDEARIAGIRASVRFGTDPDRISVQLAGEGGADVARLELIFEHATNDRLDQRVELERISPGRYEGAYSPLAEGRFYVTLEPGSESGAPAGGARAGWKLSRAFRSDATNTLELGGEG